MKIAQTNKRYGFLTLISCFVCQLALSTPAHIPSSQNKVNLINIEGAIGPATTDYFIRSLNKAIHNGANLLVVQIDTPGGLDSSMRDIIQSILASPIPVAVYVAPSGARAASAGTYLLYASHIAAMAPATNIGAATPVQIGGISAPEKSGRPGDKNDSEKESGSTMERKITNDAAAYIRGLAKLRGRNISWAEKAVREAASLSDSEALKLNVIDIIAANVSDLLSQIHGQKIKLKK